MRTFCLRIAVSLVAISAAAARIFYPNLNVDMVTALFLTLALLPWLSGVLEFAELPGGWKFKFRSLEELGERSTRIGLAEASLSPSDEERYSFQSIGLDDPNLALAGLRIEIEKRLKELARIFDIGTERRGVGLLVRDLHRREAIGNQESAIIADMIDLLNEAVHASRIDRRAAEWVMDFGPRLLKSLDDRLEEARRHAHRRENSEPT